jgi:hypothetical protein
MEVIIAPCDALAFYSKLWKTIALLLTLFGGCSKMFKTAVPQNCPYAALSRTFRALT